MNNITEIVTFVNREWEFYSQNSNGLVYNESYYEGLNDSPVFSDSGDTRTKNTHTKQYVNEPNALKAMQFKQSYMDNETRRLNIRTCVSTRSLEVVEEKGALKYGQRSTIVAYIMIYLDRLRNTKNYPCQLL